MDTSEDKTQYQDENTTEKSLGGLLKSYRERADMDIKQAASNLCLTVATLQDLEDEKFEGLPEAPYIRGYLRGYAKLANVSSSEVIALYESIRGEPSGAGAGYHRSRSQAVNDVIKPAIPPYVFQMGGVVLLLLLLIVLSMVPSVKDWATGIWGDFSQESVAATEKSGDLSPLGEVIVDSDSFEDTNTSPSMASNAGQSTRQGDSAAMDGMIQRKAQTAAGTVDASTSSANQAILAANLSQQQMTENTTDSVTATNDSATTETATTTDEVNEASSTAVDATEAVEEAATTAEAVASTGDDTAAVTPEENAAEATTEVDLSNVDTAAGEAVVKLVFKDEVWMRVNGAKNKKLFGGLKKSGETHEFKAAKPLSFKVGNAPGVDIYINGKLYDQTPYLRGVVSKFKVEAASQ